MIVYDDHGDDCGGDDGDNAMIYYKIILLLNILNFCDIEKSSLMVCNKSYDDHFDIQMIFCSFFLYLYKIYYYIMSYIHFIYNTNSIL